MKKFLFYLKTSLVVLCFLTSCRSAKSVSSGTNNMGLSISEIIQKNKQQTPKFKTLAGRLKIAYTQDNNTKTVTCSFRMEKDKTIWLSKLGVVKAIITPNRVSFYNKFENNYFDGNYQYLSDMLGVDLNFNKVQNLLLGETLFPLNPDQVKVNVVDSTYVLQSKKQAKNLELFYLLNAAHFKLNSQQFAQETEQRMLQVDYKNYQEIEGQLLPEKITIYAIEAASETKINLELKSVQLNNELSFPYTIPSGYKQIVLP